MKASLSPKPSGPRPAVRLLHLGVRTIAVLALAASAASAQEAGLSPAGSVGLVILDEKPGVSLAAGGRLSVGILRVTGVLDLSVVGWGKEQGRYEWDFLSCQDSSTGRDVSASLCPDPEVRPGLMLDAAVVPNIESDILPLFGVGYRVGTVDTPFGVVGVTGSFRSGNGWYGRFLIGGTRFLQLHFGVSVR